MNPILIGGVIAGLIIPIFFVVMTVLIMVYIYKDNLSRYKASRAGQSIARDDRRRRRAVRSVRMM
jgi:uncharacterized membrane protein